MDVPARLRPTSPGPDEELRSFRVCRNWRSGSDVAATARTGTDDRSRSFREVRDPHLQQPRAVGAPDRDLHQGGPRRPARAARRDGPRVRSAAQRAHGLGRVLTAEALADPASATLYGWSAEGHLATDGPYAESKEHLAGFFLIDCDSRERAEEIAAKFAQPGGVIELRPAMWPGGDDQ